MVGDLTIKGITKEVAADYTLGGVSTDPWGRTVVPFSAKAEINRNDFGMTFNPKSESGKPLLGDMVELRVDVKGVLKQ